MLSIVVLNVSPFQALGTLLYHILCEMSLHLFIFAQFLVLMLRVQELIAMEENSQMCVSTEQPEAADTDSKPEPTEDQETSKKKNKEEVNENDASPPLQPEGADTSQPNGTINEEISNKGKKKKKKKKEKCLKEEEEEEAEVTTMDVHGSDSSGYISDKPSKKRKHENSSDVTSHVDEESETPKSKKKKRKSVIELAA